MNQNNEKEDLISFLKDNYGFAEHNIKLTHSNKQNLNHLLYKAFFEAAKEVLTEQKIALEGEVHER